MTPATLPSVDQAWVEEPKIRNYLLNETHPHGAAKAKFFRNRGFCSEDWNLFRQALIEQGKSNPVVKITANEFGTRYVVECHCVTPDQSNPCIRTVWELKENETRPRLITAHPTPL